MYTDHRRILNANADVTAIIKSESPLPFFLDNKVKEVTRVTRLALDFVRAEGFMVV